MSTLPEERVLKIQNPVPEDVNDWPDFTLREAKVFPQGKSRYADLLEASADFPLCVIGELEPVDDDQEHLGILLPMNKIFSAGHPLIHSQFWSKIPFTSESRSKM